MSTRALLVAQEAALALDYQGGASLETLASKYGCSANTARNILQRNGVPRRPCGPRANPLSETKTCSSCGAVKPRTEFYGGGKKTSECVPCFLEKNKERYLDPKVRERSLARSRRWQAANPGRNRARQRMWMRRLNSGWTQEQFAAAWERQDGRCAICKVQMIDGGRGPTSVHADHDHSSGKTRGLLCAHCNRGIGCLKDSVDSLQAAIDYLKGFNRAL